MNISNYHRYLYPLGIKNGVNFQTLKKISNAVDYVRQLRDSRMRQHLAKEVCASSPWSDYLDNRLAYRKFVAGDIPPCDQLTLLGRDIYNRQPDAIDTDRALAGEEPDHPSPQFSRH